MDRDERFNNQTVAFKRALRGHQAGIWTALPGMVQSYAADKHTVTVQPAIQAKVTGETGAMTNTTLPVLPDVPVLFGGSTGFLMTFPIKAGDEGLVVFSSRCIDAFWQSGGIQPQAEMRMHDLSDGIFIPGQLSQKTAIPNVDPDALQIRSTDGKNMISMTATQVVLSMNEGAVTLTVDKATNKVSVVATGGFWVNGMLVAP